MVKVVVEAEGKIDRRSSPYRPSGGPRGTPAPLGYRLPLARCAKTPGVLHTLVMISQTPSWWKTLMTPAPRGRRKKKGDIFIFPMWLRIVFAVLSYKQFSHSTSLGMSPVTKFMFCLWSALPGYFGWAKIDGVFVPLAVLGSGGT